MSNETYLSLQHSESVVAAMASRIYAAYVQRGEVIEGNEDHFIKRSVHAAARIASYTDKVTKSDEEWMKAESGTSPML